MRRNPIATGKLASYALSTLSSDDPEQPNLLVSIMPYLHYQIDMYKRCTTTIVGITVKNILTYTPVVALLVSTT